MDNDRRDARAWAQEWAVRQRNKRILTVIAAIALIVALYFAIHFITIKSTRTTFSSEEEMRAALQGRFETDYCEDIEIIGDDITLTYYEISHYDREYAEKYGYSSYEDSVYEDVIQEWDYRNGVIKGKWMDEIRVDKDGNLIYYSQTFKKTTADKPVPFDPSDLNYDSEGNVVKGDESGDAAGDVSGEGTEGVSGEGTEAQAGGAQESEEEAQEAAKESLEQTEGAAEEAGVLPESGDKEGA